MNLNDPRVIRTRQMLREALIDLVIERGYDSLSIQDIADKAGLRRATFYLHYRNKEELLLSMMRDTVDELIQKIRASVTEPWGEEHEYQEARITFEAVQEKANLFRAILSGQGAAHVTRDLRDYIANGIRDNHLCQEPGEPLVVSAMPVEVLANYMAAVKLNMVIWWLEKDMPYSPDEMATMVTRLLQNGVGEMLEKV
jgi:AcrR family transcriptional regulator